MTVRETAEAEAQTEMAEVQKKVAESPTNMAEEQIKVTGAHSQRDCNTE